MKITDLAKDLKLIDIIVLWLDDKGFSDAEIATMAEITPQTLHNTKNRLKPFTEALKQVTSPPAAHGNKDVNTIIDAFTQAFGTTKTTKYDRFAAKRLADKYTAYEISGAIHALSAHQGEKYCPVVRSVSQFEEKLPNIAAFFKKKSGDQVINL